VLVPQYLQSVPVVDGWKTNFDYYLKTAKPLDPQVMAIHSYGRDKAKQLTSGINVTSFDPTDYDQDILWADGFFVRLAAEGHPLIPGGTTTGRRPGFRGRPFVGSRDC